MSSATNSQTDLPSIADLGAVKIFRRGTWYSSLDIVPIPHTHYGLHQAPSLMVLDDARKLSSPSIEPQRILGVTASQRAALLEKAIALFTSGCVFVEGWGEQTPADFAQLLWQSLGLPERLVTQWCSILTQQLALVLADRTSLPPAEGICLVSLPANTFVCLDACFRPLLAGMTLWMRPSQREPFSVLRLLSCLLAVGWVPESLGLYPTTHATLAAVAPRLTQSIIYGGENVQQLFADRANITVHGPGRAMAIVDGTSDDIVEQLFTKIVGNAGRFCLGLGTILCHDAALQLGETLAQRLDQVPLDPQANTDYPLAVRPDLATCTKQINWLQERLRDGDRVLTQRPWLVEVGDRCIPVPTLVYLDCTQDHPLLGVEVDFPFAVIGKVEPTAVSQLQGCAQFIYHFGNMPVIA